MRGRRLLLLALLLVAPGPVLGARLPKPRHGFQVRVGKYTIAPGQDLEVCEYRRLPNKREMELQAFRLAMPPGAHHFVIWAYDGNIHDDSRFPKGPVPSVACSGLSPDELIPQVLIPIQQPNARFAFPPGIALEVDPHAQVWLNPHMKNPFPTPMTPDIRFNFEPAKKGTVKHHAQGLIVGNITDIRIPAGETRTLTAEWTAPVPLTLIHLATHQHRLGTYANIEIVSPDGARRDKVYENDDWEHPHPFWPDPPIQLAAGQKMRITCTWHNTDDHEVDFGVKTTDEMCFILGFYYRDNDATTPIPSRECTSARKGLLCPFAPAVAE